jgi:hypothetical protein
MPGRSRCRLRIAALLGLHHRYERTAA